MNKSYYLKGRKYYIGKCKQCGKKYDGVGSTFCSHSCSVKFLWKTGKKKNGFKEKAPTWRGGRAVRNGYVFVYVSSGKYIGEHRVVMKKHLGRKLTQMEEVHYINGIKTDNRLKNLIVVVKDNHFGKTKCPKCRHKFLIK